jgi:hypothetical protein
MIDLKALASPKKLPCTPTFKADPFDGNTPVKTPPLAKSPTLKPLEQVDYATSQLTDAFGLTYQLASGSLIRQPKEIKPWGNQGVPFSDFVHARVHATECGILAEI